MLVSRTVWASKIHYLNDSREFALALDLTHQELQRRMDNATSKGDRDRLELLRDTIYTIEQVNTCVCCFSESSDSLSQWRGYGGGKAGFAVGFSREWFTRLTKYSRLFLHPCIYDPNSQHELIERTVDEFLAVNADAEPDYWDRDRVYQHPDKPRTFMILRHAGHDFATRLARIAPLVKDKAFADEREWRLVVQNVSVFDLNYRAGESMLIPYYSIRIGDEETFDSIREIIVGPTPHPELSMASVRSLAITAGLVNSNNSINTKLTNIPFRSW